MQYNEEQGLTDGMQPQPPLAVRNVTPAPAEDDEESDVEHFGGIPIDTRTEVSPAMQKGATSVDFLWRE